jgi:hypothetical protein
MEPGTRQIKFFDTKLQMFENLNFVPKKSLILKSKLRKISGVGRDYKGG